MVPTANRLVGATDPPESAGVGNRVRDTASSYGWIGNLAVIVGRHPPTPVAAENYMRCLSQLVERYPAGIGVITLVGPQATPRPEARETLIRTFRTHWPSIQGALFAVEGQGFAASIQRSFMTAAILVSGSRERIRISKDASLDMPWLWERMGLAETARYRVSAAVRRFRRQECAYHEGLPLTAPSARSSR